MGAAAPAEWPETGRVVPPAGRSRWAAKVEVGFTYLSKVENEKLDCTDYPSEKLIRKLGHALDADIDELMLLAEKVPDDIRDRVMQRPDAFRLLANCDDETLDRLIAKLRLGNPRHRRPKSRRPISSDIGQGTAT